MTGNRDRLAEYMSRLSGAESVFILPPGVRFAPETRACVHCGKPYVIHIQYDKCVPGIRDLCDACLVKGVRLP